MRGGGEKGMQRNTNAENGVLRCVHTDTQRLTQMETHDHALRGQCDRAVTDQVFSSTENSNGAQTVSAMGDFIERLWFLAEMDS